MPKFGRSAATGLAGEYLVGAIVANQLGWPYRMQPLADLGIDGEIELLDDDGLSTGMLLKVQCRSESGVDPTRAYVDSKHFEYWRTLALPVIVVRPSVDSMIVRWWPSRTGRPTGSSVAYDPSAAKALTSDSVSELRTIAVPRGSQIDLLVGLLERLGSQIGDLDYWPPNRVEEEVEEYAMRLQEAERRLAFAKELIRELPELQTQRSTEELERLGSVVPSLQRRLEIVTSFGS